MNNVLLLLISLAIINLNFLPNSFGRFILVEVDQKEVKRTKSGAGKFEKQRIIIKKMIIDVLFLYFSYFYSFISNLREVEKCLKEEGIPDVCLGIFKTGNGTEECNEWIDTNPGLIEMTDARLKKCVSQSTSEM